MNGRNEDAGIEKRNKIRIRKKRFPSDLMPSRNTEAMILHGDVLKQTS